MAITDLTNTTWKFNDSLAVSSSNVGGQTFTISFSSANANNSAIVTYLRIGFGGWTTSFQRYIHYYPSTTTTSGIIAVEAGAWQNEGYKTITITGGTDATNATLISWLQSNATQVTLVNSTTLETTLHTAGKYCDKNILVKSSDSNLVAENIKKDVSVFGVTGSYAGGGAALAHTATFTVDGSNYAIHSVTDGQPIVSPIAPSKTGYAFKGWQDSNGNAISFPYTMSASEETLAASFISAYYMTISGLGNSSPTSQTYVSSGVTFPTSFEEVTKDGDIFIKIPTMYRKVNTVSSNQITSFTISNVKEDDTYLPYPCFVRPDGSVMDYILIGKYMISSSSTANSVNASQVNLTPAQGIALCKNKGAGYYPYDVWTQKLFQDLELAIGKKVDYQNGSAKITVSKIGLNHLDKDHWVLGVIGSSGSWYACYDPDKYQALEATDSPIPQDYVQIGYAQPTTSSVEIQKLGYDESNPFFNYPTATVSNSSYNTYYCDGYYYSSGNSPVYSVVGFSFAYSGLWFCGASGGWSGARGVRLCFRPL